MSPEGATEYRQGCSKRSERNPCKYRSINTSPEGGGRMIIFVLPPPSGLGFIDYPLYRGSATLHHLPVYCRPFGAYTSIISEHNGSTDMSLPIYFELFRVPCNFDEVKVTKNRFWQIVKIRRFWSEILTSRFVRNHVGGQMVRRHQNRRFWMVICKLLSISEFQHFSLLTFHFSLLKGICFGLQKTVFWVVKDRLLEGKSLSFAR